MAENKGHLYGGHANRIQWKGPLVIGTDFEPPTPAASVLYQIKLEPAVLDKLNACLARASSDDESADDGAAQTALSDASLFSDAMKHLDLHNGVRRALSWFIRDTQFQPEEKSVRKELAKTIEAIERFEAALPQEFEATGRFIYGTFTGNAFLRDELKPSESELIALQDAWRERYGFIAIRDTLKTMRAYVNAAQQCLGNARPQSHRVLALVRAFAHVWEAQTGKKPVSGRDPHTSQQSGPFADFIRIAFAVIADISMEDRSGRKVWPFRNVSFDASIRKVCDGNRD